MAILHSRTIVRKTVVFLVLIYWTHHQLRQFMSEEQEFLANVEQEGESLNQVTETPAESLPESNQTEESPSSQGETQTENNTENEENVPFHKHPRWKAKQQEIDGLKKTVDELLPFKEEVQKLRQEFNQSSSNKEEPQIPDWFSRMFGDNYEAWKIWEEKEKSDEIRLEKKIIQNYENQQLRKKQEQDYWDKWINTQLSELESEGKEFNKNELLKVIDTYRPIDDNGNWDFRKGYELLQMQKQLEKKPEKSNNRKQIASLSSSESSSEEETKSYATNLDFQGGKRGF